MKYYFLAVGVTVVICVGCVGDGQQVFDRNDFHAPPAPMLAQPGPMVAGPGPGVMPPLMPAWPPTHGATTQIRFVGPEGMEIGWKAGDRYAESQLIAPGRYNFLQAATYRLKLTNIPLRDGLVLYPTLQVYPTHPTTEAYLSHNSIPLELTDEDLDQVETNNFVTKVIYLPDPKFQEPAIAGVSTLVSTRLDPGVDPVAEADKRGTIMVVLRLGNMDLEMPQNEAGPGMPDAGGPDAAVWHGGIRPVSHLQPEGRDDETEQFIAPVPVREGFGSTGVPNPTMVAGSGAPGQPGYSPISGVGNIPVWGMPMTGTPIGLPGPPHLPLGGPAGLQSHTMRNKTPQHLPGPVDHMLIDVKHEPGYRLPEPVRHIEYSEKHPDHRPDEISVPAWGRPRGTPRPVMMPPGGGGGGLFHHH